MDWSAEMENDMNSNNATTTDLSESSDSDTEFEIDDLRDQDDEVIQEPFCNKV